jgi:uncharacterized protein (UPF0218 family)
MVMMYDVEVVRNSSKRSALDITTKKWCLSTTLVFVVIVDQKPRRRTKSNNLDSLIIVDCQ